MDNKMNRNGWFRLKRSTQLASVLSLPLFTLSSFALGGQSVLNGSPTFTGFARADLCSSKIVVDGPNGPVEQCASTVDPGSRYTENIPDDVDFTLLVLENGKYKTLYSGNDMTDIFVFYHPGEDVLYVGIETNGVTGDVDGDGNPSTFNSNYAINDWLDFGGWECVGLYFAAIGKSLPQYMFGKSSNDHLGTDVLPGAYVATKYVDTGVIHSSFGTDLDAIYKEPGLPVPPDGLATITLDTLGQQVGLPSYSVGSRPHYEVRIPYFSLLFDGFDAKLQGLSLQLGAFLGTPENVGRNWQNVDQAPEPSASNISKMSTLLFEAPVGKISGTVTEDWTQLDPDNLLGRQGIPAINIRVYIYGEVNLTDDKLDKKTLRNDQNYTDTSGDFLFSTVRLGEWEVQILEQDVPWGFKVGSFPKPNVHVQEHVEDQDLFLVAWDEDDDTIPDLLENPEDPGTCTSGSQTPDNWDGDALCNYEDTDSDGDTIPDKVEVQDSPLDPPDSDGDTQPDYLDVDSDDDGILDGAPGCVPPEVDVYDPKTAECEATTSTFEQDDDDDGIPNVHDPDSDNDGILDGTEAGITEPTQDTDLSCTTVIFEGTADQETVSCFIPDEDPSTSTNWLDQDTDDDGLMDSDEDESLNGQQEGSETDPNDPDTDGDSLCDGTELGVHEGDTGEINNTDPDVCVLVPDGETANNTDPLDQDSDDDGLTDGAEDSDHDGTLDSNQSGAYTETNPNDPDTDNDNICDGTEEGVHEGDTVTINHTNPDVCVLVPDGATGTVSDPLDPDTDDDGLLDGSEDSNHNGTVDVDGSSQPTETSPTNHNSDGDCWYDGTESLLTSPQPSVLPGTNISGTNLDAGHFDPYDPTTVIDPNPLVVSSVCDQEPSPTPDGGVAMGGGGCSCNTSTQSGTSGTPLGAVLLGLFGLLSLRSRRSRRVVSASAAGIVASAAALGGSSAQAADAPAVEVQQFHPAVDFSGNIMTTGSSIVGPDKLTFALWANYAKSPLIFVRNDGYSLLMQDNVTGFELVGAYRILDFLQIGLNAPLTLWQQIDSSSEYIEESQGFAFNDINVRIRGMVLDRKEKFLGLAFEPHLTLPTGNPNTLTGGQVMFGANVIVDKLFGELWTGLNIGFRHRLEPQVLANLPIGDELQYRMGIGMPINTLWLSADLFGSLGFAPLPENQPEETVSRAAIASKPMELMLGASKGLKGDLTGTLGLSVGLLPGYGTPEYRLGLGLTWGGQRAMKPATLMAATFVDGDRDGDGILDSKDACPTIPEDFNGIEDQDGCPDDIDGDGIVDRKDQCPTIPEDKDGIDDLDGCPDKDDGDIDGDGILDSKDACPTIPEDKNGIEDEDGCPEDADNDGILNKEDECPAQPEDKDGVQDWDGCPEKDMGELIALEPIYFYVDSDRIRPISFPTLNRVARTLSDMKELCVSIQGHTSLEAPDDYNMRLSDKRSAAVKKYLIDKGISDKRLETIGFGETHPQVSEDAKAPEDLEEQRSLNRRIEWIIIDCSTVGQPKETP